MNFRVPIRACLYALSQGESFKFSEKTEKLIYTCPASSYLYAKNVLKSRIPIEFENIFSNRLCIIQNYKSYQPKKIVSNEEIKIEDFNFFSKVFKTYSLGNNKINFVVNFESDSFVIRNNYISLAYLYSKNIIKDRLPLEIEKVAFIGQPISCYLYIKDVIKNECPDYLLDVIKNNSTVLLSYAQSFRNNLEDLEILLNPADALIYAREILKDRLSKKHEEIIFSKNISCACEYAVDVVGDRLDENLHNLALLNSLVKNSDSNIKKYLFFINYIDVMKNFWNDLIEKIKKIKIKIFDSILFENKSIVLNNNILVQLKKPTGSNLPSVSISTIDNSNDTSKINLPITYQIEENYEKCIDDVICMCCFQSLKNNISRII